MLGYQSPQFLQALGADIIYDDGNGVMHICTLDASRLDRTPNAPAIESQPIWQIKRVTEVTDNGLTTTTIEFPNGNRGFNFILAAYLTYTYSFGR